MGRPSCASRAASFRAVRSERPAARCAANPIRVAPPPAREDYPAAMFRRPLLLLVLVLLLALVGGLLVIGAFPPPATQQPVERTLPNERFTTR